jgi:ATP-dependent helicase IRC3
VVASVQTLKNEQRLGRVGDFGLVVVDECHHASAASYRAILAHLGAFASDGPVVVGVTATPKRADGVRLDDVFEGVVYAKTYTDMVAEKYLVPVYPRAFDLVEQQSLGRAKLGIDGDFAEGWLEGVMLRANAPDKIVEAWQKEAVDRRTIVFTPTVSVAKAVADAFKLAGVSAAWISGGMGIKDRRDVLSGLRDGRIQVVANCAVLTEGFDEPSVSCIVIGRPTKNESLYIQMVGRGTRPSDGKRDCLILDMVGAADQLQLDAIVELGGRGPSASAERAVSGRGDGEVPFQVVAGELSGRKVRAARSACRWVELPDDWYALSMMAEGWITLEPTDDGTWGVVRRPKRGKPIVQHEGLDLEWAKVVGENVAKNSGVFGPMTRRAGWLDRPISEGQLRYGRMIGLPITPETTSWEMKVLEAEYLSARWRR